MELELPGLAEAVWGGASGASRLGVSPGQIPQRQWSYFPLIGCSADWLHGAEAPSIVTAPPSWRISSFLSVRHFLL